MRTVEYYKIIPKHVEVISKTKVGTKWRCEVYANFKSYDTPLESWLEYATILKKKVGTGCTSNQISEMLHFTDYATNINQFRLYKKVLVMVKAQLYDLECGR